MNIKLLTEICAVPTQTGHEDELVAFLLKYCAKEGWRVTADEHKNVYVTKGRSGTYPCLTAHIDSVQDLAPRVIKQNNGHLVGHLENGSRAGFGADDKAGVYLCLDLLQRLDVGKAVFFAAEECGCRGARAALDKPGSATEDFFDSIGYMLEFDSAGYGLVTYTSGGVRLFDNDGVFIHRAFPVLNRWQFNRWQRHPYTNTMVVRGHYAFPCLNLSCGYYNWHTSAEYIRLADVQDSLGMALELLATLGNVPFYDANTHRGQPLVEVTGLEVSVAAREPILG